MGSIAQSTTIENERRAGQRYNIRAPLTVSIGNRKISAFTRDLCNRGVYFYLDLADGALIDREFNFTVELPPDITLSTYCQIHSRGRVVRIENIPMHMAGIAAEILHYSIVGKRAASA